MVVHRKSWPTGPLHAKRPLERASIPQIKHNAPENTDWERFLLNAARVRKIEVAASTTITYKLEPDALLALCRAASSKLKLIPYVQHLDATFLPVDRINKQILSDVQCLLSPTITQLEINLPDESPIALLSTLIQHCPFVVEVSLIPKPHHKGILSKAANFQMVSLMHRWSCLQVLTIQGINAAGAFALSSLPFLKALTLVRVEENPPISTLDTKKAFPILEQLEILCCNTEFCIELMKRMDQKTPLKSITVCFHEMMSLDGWSSFITAMKNGIVHEQVESISLSC